jgi:hypothetical protein
MRSAAQFLSIPPPPNEPPTSGVCPPALQPLKQFVVENTGGATAVFTGICGASTTVLLLPTSDTEPPWDLLLLVEELLCVCFCPWPCVWLDEAFEDDDEDELLFALLLFVRLLVFVFATVVPLDAGVVGVVGTQMNAIPSTTS